MKQTLLLLVGLTVALFIQAQTTKDKTTKSKIKSATTTTATATSTGTVTGTATKAKADWSKLDLSSRPGDHFMIQYGSDMWLGKPDSVRTGGFSRHFNLYFMLDKPFKTDPHYSLGIGAGIGSSNMFFTNTNVNVKANTAKLPFTNVDSADHFKKFKLTTMALEIPVEIRHFSDPEHPGRSWKWAAGVKVGTLLKAYTKGKNLENKAGSSIYGNTYIVKESNKRFMNGTVLALTGRYGYGIFSVDAQYNLIGVLKDGSGPAMNKFSFGFTISGL